MIIDVNCGGGYPIVLSRGALNRAGEELDLNRRVLIVTDEGVPEAYARRVAEQCAVPVILTVKSGEGSKSFETLERLLAVMLENRFDRGDCVCAVGGGVVGDLSGFASAVYMRGVDFYNIPTTLLSQVDSSIGGKTAINFRGVKNTVGAFKRPKKVLIDPETLKTLDERQFSAGLTEALKEAATCDAELFGLIEKTDAHEQIDRIIERALRIKKAIVEEDETERGRRKILNFGHTIGHGVEAAAGGRLLHGECVAIGMLPMCAPDVRARLTAVLEKYRLPLKADVDARAVYDALLHDKKAAGAGITAVFCDSIGSCRLENIGFEDLKNAAASVCRGKE